MLLFFWFFYWLVGWLGFFGFFLWSDFRGQNHVLGPGPECTKFQQEIIGALLRANGRRLLLQRS